LLDIKGGDTPLSVIVTTQQATCRRWHLDRLCDAAV